MGLLIFLAFGLIVGLVARAVTPGRQGLGWVMTMILGIAGSFVGGFLASLITHQRVLDLHTSGFIGSVIGAIALLVLFGLGSGRRASA